MDLCNGDCSRAFDKAVQKRPSDDETRYLAIASMCGNLDYIQNFFDRYPDAAEATTSHGNGWTALMWAAREGRFPVIDYLLDKGARVETRNRDGYSVLDIASLHREKKCALEIEALQRHKAEAATQRRNEEIARIIHGGTAQPLRAFKPLRFCKDRH